MRHLHTRQLRHVTDPDTGRTYPIPMGGADDGDSGGDSDGGAAAEGGTPDAGEGDATDTTDTAGDDDGEGAGSKAAVLADLAAERKRRQQAEQERDQLREQYETEEQKRQREAAELDAKVKLAEQGITAYRTAAVETAAREAGFVDPADAAAFLDLSTIEVDATGVDRTKVTELVGELAEAKPHLLRAEERPGSDRGGSDHQQGDGGSANGDNPNDRFMSAIRSSLASRSG